MYHWEDKIVQKKEKNSLDFSVGIVDKNLPASAGYMGSIPPLGRFHMPQGN